MRYDWSELYANVRGCEACELCKNRTNVVIGEGDPHAELLFVGEGPDGKKTFPEGPLLARRGSFWTKCLPQLTSNASRFTSLMW